MATQNNAQKKNSGSSGNKKSTNSRISTAKKSSGKGGSGGGKKNGSSDKLVNVFLVLLLVTIVVLAIMYFRKGSDESEEPTGVPTQQVQPGGVTAEPGNVTGEPGTPNPDPTDVPPTTLEPTGAQPEISPTESPEPTPTPEASPSEEPTPQVPAPVVEGIGTAEADEILADVFWEVGYRFTLADSKFVLDGETYYRYDATYNGEAQKYDVLVRRQDGELYYYENGTCREFDGLPEHTKQPEDGEVSDIMTADAAAELLRQFSYTSLGLPAELDECSLMLDNWKTVVYGEECFCLNVFYNGTLAGSIYFTETAGHVYYLDEFGEFVGVR